MSELICNSCKRPTIDGLAESKRKRRANPIHGTDFSKPLSELTENVRNSLVAARAKLHDLGSLYWYAKDRTAHVEGLITCVIVTLFNTLQEINKWEEHARNTGPSKCDPYPLPLPLSEQSERERRYTSRLAAANPWVGIELSRPVSELMHDVRMDLCNIRGKIYDLSQTHFEDRFNEPHGALTCGISALYQAVEDTIAHEAEGNDTKPYGLKLFAFTESLKERVIEISQD